MENSLYWGVLIYKKKKGGKLWTYTYANNSKAQIDYVLMNKK